jgi:hypothetical protein
MLLIEKQRKSVKASHKEGIYQDHRLYQGQQQLSDLADMLFLLLLPLLPAVPTSLAGWPACLPACLPTTAVIIPRSTNSIGLWLAASIFFYLHHQHHQPGPGPGPLESDLWT